MSAEVVPQAPVVARAAEPVVSTARWVDALSTLFGSFGPRRWEDVEDAVDHVLTGNPAHPPAFAGQRRLERGLTGYENAHRIVLAGLGDAPTDAVMRWARLRLTMTVSGPRTMVPLVGGAVEILLDDLGEAFGAPQRRVPLNVSVLEALVEASGLPGTALLLAGFQVGPDSVDARPSRACQALAAMRGYDDALVRHAAALRIHLLGMDVRSQCRAAQMLDCAATSTLRVFGEAIGALSESRDPGVRAAGRVLERRMTAGRAGLALDAEPPMTGWASLGERMAVPRQRLHD